MRRTNLNNIVSYENASAVVLVFSYGTLQLVFNRNVFWIVGTEVYQHSVLCRWYGTKAVWTCVTTTSGAFKTFKKVKVRFINIIATTTASSAALSSQTDVVRS